VTALKRIWGFLAIAAIGVAYVAAVSSKVLIFDDFSTYLIVVGIVVSVIALVVALVIALRFFFPTLR
jgi:hypothetical protein